jgi:transcriptional regulator with XRE-family HTH domain
LQICENIRQARESKGYSQGFMAKELALKNRSTYQNWEYSTEPDMETLKKIAKILGIPAFELLRGVIEFPEPTQTISLNDPGEHEYKKSGSSPDSLAKILNNEILRMRSSLDTLSQVASGVLHLQPISNGEAQDLPWGKSDKPGKKKDKNNH